jgi:ADP-ribose pyrophosphatase YjhB (NUDIX family)
MVTKTLGDVVRAAGGLIWVRGLNSRKIVIVHRKTRYGNEWTLPKGHLEQKNPNDAEGAVLEDWSEAALREAHEETKCKKEDLRIESIAGPISYMDDEKPKIVLYFNMTCLSDYDFNQKITDDKEVDEVRLVNVGQALALLKYPKERLLIQEIESLATEPLPKMEPVRLLWLRKAFKSASHRRLDENIGPFEIELKDKTSGILEQLRRHADAETEPNKKTQAEEELERVRRKSNAALEALECSKKALSLGEIEIGWRYLFQAELEQTAIVTDEPTTITTDNNKSLQRTALATLNEAEKKLKSWRLETIQAYLGKNGKLKEGITPGDVYRARKIMQEHFTNMYIKVHTAGFQLGILALIALALVFPVVILLPLLSPEVSLNNTGLIFAIAMFGALGGCFSGIFSISRQSGGGKIPDQILQSWVTIARPVVGVVAALAMSGFLLSGIIQLGALSVPLVLAVSFAVGFSERLLINALELKTGQS